MAHDIFISYSHKDKNVADAICSHMENNGLRCWYAPRDIVPGADWADSIINAINTTKIMVLIFTDNSNISQQVLREVSNAVSNGVPIVPFRLTEQEPIAGMRYYLSTVHWLDAMNAELSSSINDLGELCKVMVQQRVAVGTGAGSSGAGAAAVEEVNSRIAASHAAQEKEAAAKKKKKTILIVVIAAVVVAAAVVAAILLLPKGSSNQGTGTADTGQTTNDGGDTSGGGSTSGGSFVTGVTSDSVSLDITETYTQGNSQGNLASGGYLACDGEWYYYRSNEGQCMYKMRVDGSEVTQMTTEPASWIHVYDGYIYYYSSGSNPGIKKMKTDGTDETIIHSGMAEDVRIVNDRVYYQDSLDSLHLYSMTLDGRDVVNENSLEMTYSWVTDGTYEYYSNQEDLGRLYRVKLDGSESVCLLNHKIEGMTIAGNLLYFNDLETNKFSTYDLTTGEIDELCDDYIYYINVTADGIYGYSGANNTWLCYLQLNGLGQRFLVEEGVQNVCVSGQLIFYKDDNNEYHIVDLEGNNPITP